MTRPLREVITYLVIAFSLAIGVAVAIPHAGINVLLSAFAPITAMLVITFVAHTPRQAPRAVGQLRTEPLGQAALAVRRRAYRCSWRSARTALRSSLDVADLRDFDITALGARLVGLNVVANAGLHGGPLPLRGDRLARLHAAARAAAHQPPPGGRDHRVRARVLPPAADPDRDDVRPARQPLVRGAHGGRRRSPRAASSTPTCGTARHSVWPAAIAHGAVNTALRHGCRRRGGPSQDDLAYVAGESGIATFGGRGSLPRGACWPGPRCGARTSRSPATEAALEPVA